MKLDKKSSELTLSVFYYPFFAKWTQETVRRKLFLWHMVRVSHTGKWTWDFFLELSSSGYGIMFPIKNIVLFLGKNTSLWHWMSVIISVFPLTAPKIFFACALLQISPSLYSSCARTCFQSEVARLCKKKIFLACTTVFWDEHRGASGLVRKQNTFLIS